MTPQEYSEYEIEMAAWRERKRATFVVRYGQGYTDAERAEAEEYVGPQPLHPDEPRYTPNRATRRRKSA